MNLYAMNTKTYAANMQTYAANMKTSVTHSTTKKHIIAYGIMKHQVTNTTRHRSR